MMNTTCTPYKQHNVQIEEWVVYYPNPNNITNNLKEPHTMDAQHVDLPEIYQTIAMFPDEYGVSQSENIGKIYKVLKSLPIPKGKFDQIDELIGASLSEIQEKWFRLGVEYAVNPDFIIEMD